VKAKLAESFMIILMIEKGLSDGKILWKKGFIEVFLVKKNIQNENQLRLLICIFVTNKAQILEYEVS
jgi:hypothetical protein